MICQAKNSQELFDQLRNEGYEGKIMINRLPGKQNLFNVKIDNVVTRGTLAGAPLNG